MKLHKTVARYYFAEDPATEIKLGQALTLEVQEYETMLAKLEYLKLHFPDTHKVLKAVFK
tara:strand:+ start:3756 stop:3935 length:180 start_codon:yes stop_codon:yes gene_type:complete